MLLPLLLAGTPAAGQSLQVMERWSTLREPGRVEFGSIGGMAEHADGRIWIADPINRTVTSLSAAGTLPLQVAGPGQGPGEVEAPGLLATYPAIGTGVYDGSRRSIHLFDREAAYVRTIFLRHLIWMPKGLAFLSSGEVVVSGGIDDNAGGIHVFASDGALVRSWHPLPQTENPRASLMTGGGAVAATRQGGILFSQAAPHEIVLYSNAGRRTRRIAAAPGLVSSIGDDFITEQGGRRTFRWDFPRSVAVFELADGRILNVVWNPEERWSLWQIYEPTGRLVRQVRVQRAYRAWAHASNGDVLASYEHPDTGEHIAVRLALAWDGVVPALR